MRGPRLLARIRLLSHSGGSFHAPNCDGIMPQIRPLSMLFIVPFLALLLAGFSCVSLAAAKEPSTASAKRGIVAEAPAGVRSFKVDGGYMVPYTEKIPNTDISFEMIPVPGGEFLLGSPAS